MTVVYIENPMESTPHKILQLISEVNKIIDKTSMQISTVFLYACN